MDDMLNAYKVSDYKVTVQYDDEGFPLCPEDGLRLVEESPGFWSCPLTLAFEDAMRKVLEAGSNPRYDGSTDAEGS